MIRVRRNFDWTADHRGGSILIGGRYQWVRLAAYYGIPPGSHTGMWLSRWAPLRGVNIRFTRTPGARSLTVFVHIRRGET